jgi:invasion protein IalB
MSKVVRELLGLSVHIRQRLLSICVESLALCIAFCADTQLLKAKTVETKFDDWQLTCAEENLTGAVKRSCKISQVLADKTSGQTVFAMTVLPAAKKDTFVAVISAPFGGYLVPGMELSVDSKKPYKVLFETCNADGCHAGFEIKGRIRDDLSRGKVAKFKIWTTKTKPAEVSVSLAGFGSALSSLKDAS